MQRRELEAWLRLTLTPGVGNAGSRKLLAAFALPEAIFEQPRDSLEAVLGEQLAQPITVIPEGLEQLLETSWRWLQEPADPDSPVRRIVALGEPDYPSGLLDIDDPPLLLYLLGSPNVLPNGSEAHLNRARTATHSIAAGLQRSVAIVGTRNPTPQGAINARHFARALADTGLVVVSGMALGIDAAAHEGALESAATNGAAFATVAVIGTGLDRVYPKSHHVLARRIARRGLIVSEFPLGTPALPGNFPRRNRIIAGLGQGTLVVEAALRSGSLITARLTAEQGKDVFAIPGSIHATQSHGCHALIRQGAKLVESVQDVLEELEQRPGFNNQKAPIDAPDTMEEPTVPTEDPLLAALGHDPGSLDALQARTGLATAELQARLMTLELEQKVARLPGGLFQRIFLT